MNSKLLIQSKNLSNGIQRPLNIKSFSLEKIFSSISHRNRMALLKKKYTDQKIPRNKEIETTNRYKSIKIKEKLDEEMYSPLKINYHKYKDLKDKLINTTSLMEIIKKKKFNKNNINLIFPSIFKNKKINQSCTNLISNNNDYISTTGMLNKKRLIHHKINKITINSLIMNAVQNNHLLINNYSKLNHIYSRNNRNNLNYNLNSKQETNKENFIKLNLKRKLTKIGLLNNLYHKYSSVSNDVNNSNTIDINSQNKEKKIEIFNDNSSNISIDLGKEISEMTHNINKNNHNNGRNRTFLTKMTKSTDNIDINKIIYRHNNEIWNIKKKNEGIIDIDQKIYINCLLSKVESNIQRDKIVYENNGKTIYEFDKEFSYRRLKRFENLINKLIAKKK